MPRRVCQLLAGYAEGDAISREARAIRESLAAVDVPSEIYAPADRIAEGSTAICRALEDYRIAETDITLLHDCMAPEPCRLFMRAPGRKVFRYHNITPAEFYDAFDDTLAARLRAARGRLPAIVGEADAVWADSEFNAAEAREAGAGHVQVVPLFFEGRDADTGCDPAIGARLGAGLTNILFVGRMAPNKCVEELILAFGWYNRCINDRSRLVLVGSDRSCPRYYAMLRMLVARLDLPNVCFEGFVSDAGLAACYEAADVFVSASRHEGYCLPLIEAMSRGVPVIARACGGMPEALDGSGVLFDEAEPRELAELIHRVLTDAPLREAVLESQEKRVEAIRARDLTAECRRLLVEESDP